jgi:hypothetical protein
MSINVDLMEKCELQRMFVKLFNQFEEFKNSSIDHLQRLKKFEIEKYILIGKIKSLEDALMKSKLHLEKPFDSSLSIDCEVPHRLGMGCAYMYNHTLLDTTRFKAVMAMNLTKLCS